MIISPLIDPYALRIDGSIALGGAWDMGSHALTNVNIDSGTIDGAIIGGAAPAAGTFTALAATGAGSIGDGLTVNANNSSAAPLVLEGHNEVGADRGGSIKWHKDDTTVAGYIFANSHAANNKCVWSENPQSAVDDTGAAWIDFHTGSAAFSGGINDTTIGATSETTGKFTTLTLTAPTGQDYKWLTADDVDGSLALQGQSDDIHSGLHFYTKKGDDVSSVFFRLYKYGIPDDDPQSADHYERLNIIGVAGGNFRILSQALGDGTLQQLALGVGAYTTQIVLNTDGTTTFGDDVIISSGGQILADDGTMGAPGISFALDSSTGIYYGVTGDHLLFSAASTKTLDIISTSATFSVPLIGTTATFTGLGIFTDLAVNATSGDFTINSEGGWKSESDTATDTINEILAAGGNFAATRCINAAGGPQVIYRRGRGTSAAPLYPNNNDTMGTFNILGWDENTSDWTTNRAQFIFQASENWDATSQGTKFAISLTPNGSTTKADVLIASNGNVNIVNDLTMGGALNHDGSTVGFFATTPVTQNQLATGVGKTVDEVITELQRLGLVRQAA